MKAKPPQTHPPVIGLTGGIGSGKSTVAQRLSGLGARVIDADRAGHLVLEPDGSAYGEVVRTFGPEILDSEGRIVRKRLGGLVFADPAQLAKLNAISHPLMAAQMEGEIASLRKGNPPPAAIVLDAAILYQAGWDKLCDTVWTVSVEDETAIVRLAARNGLNREEARARLAAQWSNSQREVRAQAVIRNDGSLEELHRRVDSLWRERIGRRPEESAPAGGG